jgi:DNA mismatch repair protein MutS2
MRVRKDEVRVLAQTGPRVEAPGRAPRFAGLMPAATTAGDLTAPVAREEPSAKIGRRPEQGSEGEAPAEINVIGNTAEEARERVDKFLDQAFLAGRFRLRVIHGFGKGILRKNLHAMFASHPHVDKFYPAPAHEGGAGATIVELKL